MFIKALFILKSSHTMMGRTATNTKENRKGNTRSYNYYKRRFVLILFALASASLFTWKIYTQWHILSSKSDEFGTMANHPIRSIDYGVAKSTPVVMIRSSLDKELHQRFLEEHLYSCSENELNDMPELDNRVNKPVYVYEGYYHSLSKSQTIYSKNPNPLIGRDFDKPAASAFTRAFYDAFRIVNKEIFDTLTRNLLAASSFNNSTKKGEEDVCYVLAKWIERGLHFGDLSVQIHYGRGNEDKLTSGRAWHTDAENSLLHLAVTLRGTRVLHSFRVQTQQQQSNNSTIRRQKQPSSDSNVQERIMTEVLERQEPGDVYLSSSTLMRHAPQFFDTDYASRSIAIHARILYTSAEVEHFRKVRTGKSWEALTNVLANTLAAARLRIPSLAQVESRLLFIQQSSE